MKLKKILAALAALAMATSAFASIAFAGDYGSPELTFAAEYPSDPDGDGSAYLAITVGYDGITGLSRNNTALKSIALELTYDDSKLTFEFGEDLMNGGTVGNSAPSYANAWSLGRATPYAGSAEFYTAYFSVDDSVDFSKDAVTFGVVTDQSKPSCLAISIQNSSGTAAKFGATSDATEELAWEAYTYGTSTPTPEYVNVTTDGNVEGVADGQVEKGSKIAVSAKEVSGKTAKLYANGAEIVSGAEYTFDADVSFTVVYEDEVVTPEYTYSVTDYGKSESLKAIFYALSIVNPDTAMTLGVAGKGFTASGLPEVDGGASVDMTYVIKGVPENILTNVPEAESLTGAKNGEYTLK